MSFLVAIVRLDAMAHGEYEGLVFNPVLGHVDDLGFCGHLDRALSHRPHRPERVPYDTWCRDRFFCVQPDDHSGSFGSVEIVEALVYDDRMRGEIDFTGLRVIVSLQKNAFQSYLDYVGTMRLPALGDHDLWEGRILVRIPSRPFAFPMPRGSARPGEVGKQAVGRLKLIERFAFDNIEVQALRDEQGRRVKFDDAAHGTRPNWQPALSLCA